jgi:hypothetical protein
VKEGETPQLEIKLPEPRWLTGRVVDADSSAGIAGAYLFCSIGMRGSSAVSGKGGEFRIPVVPGRGKLSFQHEVYGYLAPTYGALPRREQAVPSRDVEIADSGPIEPLTIKLSRGLVVRGRVSGPDGKPAAGASIRAQNSEVPFITRWAVTDAEGRFEVSGLLPLVGTLVTALTDGGTGFAQIAAQPEQPWDQTRFVDLPLSLHAGVTLTGRVLFEGRGRAGVRLKVTRTIGENKNSYHALGEYVTGADGRYRIGGFDPGDHYQLNIVDAEGLAAPEWEYQGGYIHSIPQGESEVVLPDAILVRSGQSLRGIVVDPQGKPVAGISVSARLLDGNSLSRTGDGPPPWTKTGDDGRFDLQNLPLQPLELMAYRANPRGGIIRFPAKVRPALNQQDIRILLDPTLVEEIEDLDKPKK